jgi:membrane-bound lytic murein transglycosylase B
MLLAPLLIHGCAEPVFEQGPPRLAVEPEATPLDTRLPGSQPLVQAAAPTSRRELIAPLPLASCGDTAEGFPAWMVSFRQHAIAQGVSAATVSRALVGIDYNPRVVELDRSQTAFKLTFEQFAARHLTKALVARGRQQLRERGPLLAKIEEQFGVPPAIVVSLWGLETDYGNVPVHGMPPILCHHGVMTRAV